MSSLLAVAESGTPRMIGVSPPPYREGRTEYQRGVCSPPAPCPHSWGGGFFAFARRVGTLSSYR